MKKFLLLALVAIIAVSAFAGKVTIWSWRTQDAKVWEEVEAALKSKGLDITIEYTAFAPTEYDSKVALASRPAKVRTSFTPEDFPEEGLRF